MYSQNEATLQLPPLNPSRIEEQGVSIRDYVDLLIEGRKIILIDVAVGAAGDGGLFGAGATHLQG